MHILIAFNCSLKQFLNTYAYREIFADREGKEEKEE